MNKKIIYGIEDATFQAAGGVEGIRRLVDAFFDIMESNPNYRTIWLWHPDDNEASRDKLARFLCGWTGGPRLFKEKYGPISLPAAHAHLNVTANESGQWLSCMGEALDQLNYPEDFKQYLLTQLAVPAGRIEQACQRHSS